MLCKDPVGAIKIGWIGLGFFMAVAVLCGIVLWPTGSADASYPTRPLQHASYGDRIKVDRGRVHRIRFDQDRVTCYYGENWSNDAISLFCVQDK